MTSLIIQLFCFALISRLTESETINALHQQHVLETQQRLLVDAAGGNQHQFRIFPHINPPPESSGIDQSMLTKAMSIAGTYFKKTLTVTDRHTMFQTMLSTSNPICNTALKEYKYKGFNPNSYDAVVATHYQKQPQKQQKYVIASGIVCKRLHWPIYGTVTFITDNINIRKNQSNIKFYENLMTIIHQYIHIFALNPDLFESFYKDYNTQNSIFSKQDIVVKSPNNTSQYMVVSPIVKAYIQNLFNCKQNIGAILQQLGGDGVQKSHWDQIVFHDQVQTKNAYNFLFITNLTLSLFGDTNFYKSVNYSMAESIVYGKGKGCDFALGQIRPKPQFCDQQTQLYGCDFYNLFKGVCVEQKTGDSHKLSKMRDLDSQRRDFSDPTKRCIKVGLTGSWRQSYQKAVCFQNKIVIYLDETNVTCQKEGQQVQVGKLEKFVVCPNIQAFCARKLCSNWCDKQGICVRGQCIMDSPVQKQQLRTPGILFLIIFSIFFGACLYYCWTWGSPPKDQTIIENQSQSMQQR